MRQGQNGKRGRNQRRRQGGNVNRALDSTGPDVKIRGTAAQILDKYQALARDAQSAGDRVKAENYLQHAEHYFRILQALQPNTPMQQDNRDDDDDDAPSRGDSADSQPRSISADDEQPSIDDETQSRDDGEEDRKPRAPRRRRPRRSEDGERSEASNENDGGEQRAAANAEAAEAGA